MNKCFSKCSAVCGPEASASLGNLLKMQILGTSLVVLWLRLCAPSGEDLGSIQPFNGQKSGMKSNTGASVSSSVKWETNHELLISECEGMHFPFERQCKLQNQTRKP